MPKHVLRTLIVCCCLMRTLPGKAQVKYLPREGVTSPAYAEFTMVPFDSLRERRLLLVAIPSARFASLSNRSDTLRYMQDSAVIIRLLKLNNALATWWTTGLATNGNYFFTDVQQRIQMRNMYYFRLYLFDEPGHRYDVYYLALNMNSNLFRMAGAPDMAAASYFTNTRNWNRGLIVQKHLLEATEAAAVVPPGCTRLFEESYYHCPDLLDENKGVVYAGATNSDWKTFRIDYAAMPPARNRKPPDADKAKFRKYSVHYLKP